MIAGLGADPSDELRKARRPSQLSYSHALVLMHPCNLGWPTQTHVLYTRAAAHTGAHTRLSPWCSHPPVSLPAPQDLSIPAGLTNLGATCYANAVLQCLFANAGFREELLACPEPERQQPVLRSLRTVFALMQAGKRTVVNPTEFAQALELDMGVQQDGQEFIKLLLQLVDGTLKNAQREARISSVGSAGLLGRVAGITQRAWINGVVTLRRFCFT